MIFYFRFIVNTAAHTRSTINCTIVQNQRQCGSIKLTFELKFLISKTPSEYSPGPIQFSFMQQDTTSAVLCCVQTVTFRGSYDSWGKCLGNGKRCHSPPHTHRQTHTHGCANLHHLVTGAVQVPYKCCGSVT